MAQVITTVMTVIVLLLVAIGALKGWSNGISRMAVRFLTIILSIIFAALIASSVGNSIINQYNADTSKTIFDAIKSSDPSLAESLKWILEIDSAPIKYIAAIPVTLVICPIMFVPLFVIISALMMIPQAIFCAIFRLTKKKNNVGTKLCGLLLGALQGLVVSAMIFMPMVGVSSAISESVAILNTGAPNDESTIEITEPYNEYVKGVTEGPLVKTLSFFGAKITYNSIATIKIDGDSINMTELVPDTTKIYAKSTHLSGFDWKSVNEDNKATINSIVETLLTNKYYSTLLTSLIREVAYSYSSGAMPFELGEPFNNFVSEAVAILQTIDTDTVSEDVHTILDVYYVLSEDGVFMAMEATSDEMLVSLTKTNEDGTTTISKVITIIKSNNRIKSLITLLTKLSISVMSNQTGIDANISEAYDGVKGGLNDALQITKDGKSEEEYLSEVSDSIEATLNDNGIALDKEIINNMAKFVSDNFEAGQEVTDDDMNDIILSYYDAYLEAIGAKGETPAE